MCCRYSRIAANGTPTRTIGVSREERTNASLPPKKSQDEKEANKQRRTENTERRRRRRTEAQQVTHKEEGRQELERMIARHQAMRAEGSPS